MIFSKAPRNRRYTFRVNDFLGGVNYADGENRVNDNQLTDAENMRLCNGALITRRAIVPSGQNALFGGTMTPESGTLAVQENTARFCDAFDKSGQKRLIYNLTNVLSVPEGEIAEKLDFAFFEKNGDITGINTLPKKGAIRNIIPFNNDGELFVFIDYGCDNNKRFGAGNTVFPLCYRYNDTADRWDEVERKNIYAPTVFINGKAAAGNDGNLTGDAVEGYNILCNNYTAKFDAYSQSGNYRYNLPFYYESGEITANHTASNGITSKHSVDLEGETVTVGGVSGVIEGTAKADGYKLFVSVGNYGYWFSFVDQSNNFCNGFADEEYLQNNIEVIYSTNVPNAKEREITLCGAKALYGGAAFGINGGLRTFVAGNPKYKNRLRWSCIDNPFYYPENCYSSVGDDSTMITALAKQGSILVIFKENSLYYTSGTRTDVESDTLTDISTQSETFPIVLIDAFIGCDLPKTVALCQNRLIWANSDSKVYLLASVNQFSNLNAVCISALIEKEMKKCSYESAYAVSDGGNYYLILGKTVFQLDYSNSGIGYICSYSSNASAMKKLKWMKSVLPANTADAIASGGEIFLICPIFNNKYHTFNKVYSYCGVYRLREDSVYDEVYLQKAQFAPAGGRETESHFGTVTLDGYMDREIYPAILGGAASGDYTGDITPQTERVKIVCAICTKLYDFFRFEKQKKIELIHLDVLCFSSPVRVDIISGKGRVLESRESKGRYAQGSEKITIMPNLPRVNQLMIKVSCEGRFGLTGMTVNYKQMGSVN